MHLSSLIMLFLISEILVIVTLFPSLFKISHFDFKPKILIHPIYLSLLFSSFLLIVILFSKLSSIS